MIGPGQFSRAILLEHLLLGLLQTNVRILPLDSKTLQVNIMSDWFVESANHACGDFPEDVDEMVRKALSTCEIFARPPGSRTCPVSDPQD